jgi:hypothetical protein
VNRSWIEEKIQTTALETMMTAIAWPHIIYVAALSGNTAALKIIITNEPNKLQRQDDCYCIPLHCAILSNHPKCAQPLLKNGANLARRGGALSGNRNTLDNNNAVTIAAVFGHTRSLVTLLEFRLQLLVLALLKAAAVNRIKTMLLFLASSRDVSD